MENTQARIKAVRKQSGLSQVEFAQRLGVKENQIIGIENNKQQIPGIVLERIVEIFQVDGNWLLTGSSAGQVQEPTATTYAAAPDGSKKAARLCAWLQDYASTHTKEELHWLEVEIARRFPEFNQWLENQGQTLVSASFVETMINSIYRRLSPESQDKLEAYAEMLRDEQTQGKK